MLRKQGYILLDALVGAAMLGIILAALLPTIGLLNIKASKSSFETEATTILVSGIEKAYNDSLTNWSFSVIPSELVHAKFTRVMAILPVCRDSGGLQTTCGTLDSDSKIVKATVTWDESGVSKNITSQLLLYNYNN